MKLDKNTKWNVQVGDYIRFKHGDMYKVITVLITCGKAVNYTLQDVEDKRYIYLYPSSKCYGAEILKANKDI